MAQNAPNQLYSKIDKNFYGEQLNSRNPLRRWFHSNRYRIIRSFVEGYYFAGADVLDIGTGSCDWNAGNLPVFGLDRNERLLANGKEKGRLTGYRMCDFAENGLPQDSFDIAVASEFPEHALPCWQGTALY